MARIILGFLMLFVSTSFAAPKVGKGADADPAVLGTWLFSNYRYQNQELPIPNPDLKLTFEFLPDGMSKLQWSRQGENGTCLRWARYNVGGGTLSQVVVWLDPKNRDDCSKDPDMQMGKPTQTPLPGDQWSPGNRFERR